MRHKFSALGAVMLIVIGAWFFMSGQGTPQDTSLLATETVSDLSDPATQGLVETLIQLRSIQLDGAVFQSQAFLALHDFHVETTPEPVGRPNPFAPLVRSSAGGGSAGASPTLFRGAPSQISTPIR